MNETSVPGISAIKLIGTILLTVLSVAIYVRNRR
jgi:hypothetical protein